MAMVKFSKGKIITSVPEPQKDIPVKDPKVRVKK